MANEIYQQILTNQNTEYRANQAQRESINNQLTKALSSLDKLANRVYGYTYSAVVTDNLEKDYQDIITANTDLANISAVGLLAILKPGTYTLVPTQPADWTENYDKYFYLFDGTYLFNMDSEWDATKEYYSYSGDVVRTQGNLLYINGKSSDGYTFRGVNSENGIELVKIWYFEKNNDPITLQGDCPFNTSVLLYKVKTHNPDLSDSYKSAQTVISDGDYNVTGNCIKNLIFKNNTKSNNVANTMNFYSEQEVFNVSGMISGTSLKTVSFPYLDTIQHPIYNSIMFNNISAKLEFPNLKNIFGGNSNLHIVFGASGNPSPFNLIIPESVEKIEKVICVGGFGLLRLDCKDAKSISDDWCYDDQPNFQMCNDWGASINISVAAGRWSPQNFIDLLSNKDRLRNVGFDIADNNGDADYDSATGKYIANLERTGTYQTKKYITIPQNKLSSLDSETLDIAFQKGWKVQGG